MFVCHIHYNLTGTKNEEEEQIVIVCEVSEDQFGWTHLINKLWRSITWTHILVSVALKSL